MNLQESWQWTKDKSAAIIIYYSSESLARIEITGKDDKEKELLDSVKQSINVIQIIQMSQ